MNAFKWKLLFSSIEQVNLIHALLLCFSSKTQYILLNIGLRVYIDLYAPDFSKKDQVLLGL